MLNLKQYQAAYPSLSPLPKTAPDFGLSTFRCLPTLRCTILVPTDDHVCHFRRYKASELEDKVQKAGFRVLFSSFLPLMIIARSKKRRRWWNDDDAMAGLRVGGPANTLLEKLLYLENRLIRLGYCFPFEAPSY